MRKCVSVKLQFIVGSWLQRFIEKVVIMNTEEIRQELEGTESCSDSSEDFSPDEDSYIPDSSSDTSSFDSIQEDQEGSDTHSNNIADEHQTENTTEWNSPATGVTLINFEESFNLPDALQNDAGSPFQYYRKFLTDGILDIIVEETNKNANSQIYGISTRNSSRMNKWKDTDRKEIMEFLAIVMYMGMVKYPSITDYWKATTLFKNSFVPHIMTRNRFQILLKFIHFADNAQSSETVSKTFKVDKLLQESIATFKRNKSAGKNLVIDESMIPFRGRLRFRQYLPGKAHKYGIKLFKLADSDGYIYNFKLYTGKSDTTTGLSLATNICLQLMEGYFRENRTLTVDNYYTSIELGNALLNRKIQGTLRKNRKGLPKLTRPLKRGECVTFEKSGMVVGYWRDKREVRFLSTVNTGSLVSSGKKNRLGQDIFKPDVIIEYNKCKQGIDVADQMASYFSPLRKTIRWYHKVVFDVLLNTAVINAYILFNQNNYNMKISEFWQNIILNLSGRDSASIARTHPQGKHILTTSLEVTRDGRRKRHRCGGCYSELKTTTSPSVARKKAKLVATYCTQCPRSPFLCLNHFQQIH